MRIFYSLSGEGLGHAIRTASLLENLDKKIEVHIFTWGEAYDFFEQLGHPHLYKIADLPFGRDKNNQISTIKTVVNFFRYGCKFPSSFLFVRKKAKELKPDLFISDFESLLPRVAHWMRKPLFSVDNQHRFSRCKLKGLSLGFRLYAYFIGMLTELYVPHPDKVVISTVNY